VEKEQGLLLNPLPHQMFSAAGLQPEEKYMNQFMVYLNPDSPTNLLQAEEDNVII
jgi:hypothetical protein